MASFAEYKKKKKEEDQFGKGMTFTEYTQSVLGKDDIEAPTYKTYKVSDDIAPTRDTSGYFQKSAHFDDGYQVFDVAKTAGATAADIGENVAKCGANWLEKIWDGMLTLGTKMGQSSRLEAAQNQMIYNTISGNNKANEGIIERTLKEQEEAEKATAEYVAKDIIKEENIDFGVDEYSVLGEKSDALVQSGTELLIRQGISLIPGVGVPLAYMSTGLSVMGGEAENAFNQGATYDEAVLSGMISAGAEIGSEALFGGIKIGGKALTDAATSKIASTVSSKTLGTLAKWGFNAIGEGVEEIVSGILSAVGQKLTYANEKEFNELFSKEDAWDNFIGGVVLGGFFDGVNIAVSKSKGIDYITGLTNNEKAVVDKVYQDAVAEKEKTKGKKLTTREKTAIFDDVIEQAEKGYISTDTIEEVLGGETYKAYAEAATKEETLQKEFTELNQMKQGEMTGEQLDRRAELKQQLEELKNTSNKDNLKTRLSDEVYNLVKDSKLAESYNEKSRRGQAFEADLTQYEEKYQGTIKKAVESGILNNTRRTHEMVDFVAKISADKGVLFDFTDNEKLKNSSFAVDGKTVNGFVNENGDVVLNINSAKSLNSTAGHEITHILEGTELYQSLSDIITEYARTKGEYDSRLEALNKLYEGVYKGEDFADKVNKELVADLVGDYIFTDKAFVQKLSTENRNLFQKIYDEIKYLCKVATAGSKEARELEKVKKTFAEVYRDSGNTNKSAQTNTNTAYSLSADSEGTKLSKEQQDFFKDSKMRDENGNLKVMYHGSQDAGFHIFDANMSDDNTSFFFVDRNDVAASYSGTTETYEARTIKTAEDMNNFLAEIGYDDYKAVEKDGKFELLENNEHITTKDTAQEIYEEFCWYEGVGEGDANYKVYLNLKNPLVLDAKGRNWNNVSREFSQELADKYNSLTAEEKAALVDLAGWEDFQAFRDEILSVLEQKSIAPVGEDQQHLESAIDKLGGNNINISNLFSIASDNFSAESIQEFAVKQMNTRDYAKRAKEQGYDGVIFKNIHDNGGYSNGSEGASTVAIAFESNQIKSVANEKPTSDPDIRYSLSTDTQGRELTEEQKSYFKDSKIVDENGNLKVMYHGTEAEFNVFDIKKARASGTYGKGFYFTDSISHAGTYGKEITAYLNITNPLQNGTNDITKEQLRKFVEAIAEDEDYGIENYGYEATIDSVVDSVYGKSDFGMILDLNISCVGDMVEAVKLFNEVNGTDYNGIVAPTETVAFYPEQIKRVDNKTPTDNADIRFSLSEPVEETKDLVAVHNLSEEKLAKSLKLGGLPMPSIAIARAKDGHSGFGKISLVFNKETIDPQFMRSNKVYSGDAWTPVYPRVEYKVSRDTVYKVQDKISELFKGTDYEDVFGYLGLDTDNIQDYLNRNGGDIYDAYGRKTALKLAFLKDNGVELELPTKQEQLSDRFDNDVVIKFAEKYGEEKIRELNNSDSTSVFEKYIPEVKEIVEDYYSNLTGEKMEWQIGLHDVYDFLDASQKYFRRGIQSKTDTSSATRKMIDEAVDETAYKKWLDNLFSGIIEKEGIRNNKDLFTPSGNRRSFEALHYEHNLENVIKAMKENGDKGIGAFGNGNIFGASTTEYGSIAEVKEDAKNRMKLMSESDYEEVRSGFRDRFFDLAYSLPIHKDSFTATDSAANMLIEAVAKFKTKSGMSNYLRNESKGWANYSDNVVDELIQLVSEIRAMPVGYFEAKPHRAVGFDEVATAIIPDSASAELKQMLTDNGIPFVEYESGNEQARTDALNSLESAKFSLSAQGETPTKHGNFNIYGDDVKLETEPKKVEDIAPVMDDTPITEEEAIALARENLASLEDSDAPLEVETEYYEAPDTTKIDKETLKNISKALQDTLFLTPKETKAIREIVQEYSTTEFPSKTELFEKIQNQFGEKVWQERNNEIADVKSWIRKVPIKVSQHIKSNIEDYNDFRKRNFGKIRISNEGVDVDTAYQELAELYPEYFGEEITNEVDQLLRIEEVASLDIYTEMSDMLEDATIQEAVNIITDEISEYKEYSARIEAEDMARESLQDIAPLRADQIVSKANSQDGAPRQPIDTVEYRQAKKLQSLETELADNEQLRSEAVSDYSNRIARLVEEYEALKDKNSRKANDIVRRVTRLERLKKNVDADYSKRISGLETRIAEMKQNVKTDITANVLVDEPTVEKKKGGALQSFVTNFVDKGAVFENLALKTKNRELQAKYNSLHYSEGIAQRLIGKGTNGVKALNDIKAEVESTGKTEEFYNYLYHRHNVDRMNLEDRYDDVENKPVFGDYVTSEVSQKEAAKYELKNPEFKALAEDVYAYMNYLRNQLVEKGVISQDTADLWAEMYPHYVPIRRVGDSGLNINVALDTNKTGVNAPIKKATGGNSDILPLFDTMAMRTLQTFKASAKNSFGVELKNTLGTTIETAKTDIDEIIDSVDSHEELLQEGKNGQAPTFTVFENGERVTFEITEEMYDALKPTNKHLAKTYKLPNAISNLQRNILTQYNPTFMLTNAVKDAQDVLMNSQHPAKTYANFPQAIAELISGKGQYYAEYLENGGEQNTYFEKDTNAFTKEKSTLRKVVGFPIDVIGEANDFIEKIPRLAEYIASRKSGASVEVAMLDSARVTTNFAAGGDVTKFLNKNGATFLNASVQGAMQQVRNVREAKANGLKGWVGLATKTIIAGLPVFLLNGLLWEEDEDYEELSDYVKDSYYIVGKTQGGKFIRIPKGRAVAVIQDAFEQIGNAITGNDEVDFANFFDLVITNLAPNNPLDNNIIAPIMQVARNKTWYGEDLVPTRLQDVPKAEQYDESTDALSKWLGEKTNTSPIKINYLLNQYSGGIGDVLLPMGTPEAESGDNSFVGNLLAPLKDKFTTDSVMNNQNVSNFYDKVDELTVNANSSTATDEDILKNKYMNSVNAELGELYQQKREIQNSSLSDNVKYERVRNIQEQINNLARESLNTYNNVSIDGGYATVGDLHYRKNNDGEWQKVTDKQYDKQEEVTNGLGISASDYWSNKEEYDYAYEYPEKYAVSKAVGGYDVYKSYSSDLYDIKADKDSNGKSISGSRKEKVIDYINNLDADYGEKIILFKSEYNADDTYNYDIIDYLNSREDISYEEMATILKELGFEVDANGNISWD